MTTAEILEQISTKLAGAVVDSPSGQLAGHAGGLPFEELVHQELEKLCPGRAFRHYQALNKVLELEAKGVADFRVPEGFKFGPEPLHNLVRRGASATRGWSLSKPFEEKQNDTAESIVFSNDLDGFNSTTVSLVDVKSQRSDRSSQPPNIISARKLALTGETVVKDGNEPTFEILYIGVKFKPITIENKKKLQSTDWRVVELFKIPPRPKSLYINWAAATQIQFHPMDIDQSYEGTRLEWFDEYLHFYANSLEARLRKQYTEVDRIRRLLES